MSASPVRPHAVKSKLHELGFVKSSVASMRAAKNATPSVVEGAPKPDPISTARSAAVIQAQDVVGAVTVVGVTWPTGSATAKDEFQIRTLTGGTWGHWNTLDIDPADGADQGEGATPAAATHGGTSPYVVTGASKFEVRSLTTAATAPTDAKVQVIDPGASSADNVQPAQPVAGAASAAAAKPVIFTRAAWGADESLRRGAPSYGRIQVGFVHHTDSANSYTASEVPAMLRGIYAYHVKSQGWADIGYNFLVDRFGRSWEGRFGGMTKAVVGAQTLNFNSVSMGVSAIGNYETGAVPQAMTDAYKKIFAWKFGLAGIPAKGTIVLHGVNLNRISGHRDAFATACPGRFLYAKLAEIRTGTAAIMGSPPVVVPPVVAPPVAKPPVVVTPAAAPWAVTRYTPYKASVLKQGSKSSAVVVLQRGLRITADGAFGPKTRSVLVAFQKQQHILANGVTSRLVWDRLEKRDYPLIAYRRVTVRQGSTGAVVVVVQKALRLTADGAFGPKTVAGVKAVQRTAKLAQSGVVSGWTWVAIEKAMPR
jgi:peptidoglycan hydrolase-like protein with peptidoglycan-binding domain